MLQSIAYRGDCPNCPVPEQCDQLKTLTGHQKQSIAFFQAWWHGWLPKEQGGLKNSGCCLLPLGDWRLASLFTATYDKDGRSLVFSLLHLDAVVVHPQSFAHVVQSPAVTAGIFVHSRGNLSLPSPLSKSS